MKAQIEQQLSIIKNSIEWGKHNLNEIKQKNTYESLIKCRRTLKKKYFALTNNPSVAIYGESQMGKSYLVRSLLSETNNQFTIVDGNNEEHDFILNINPIGGGTESTSLITRFSTKYEWIDPSHPIKTKLLSPTDLILVLCDTYYNDIASRELINRNLQDKINAIISKLPIEKNIVQELIGEDEIYDIKEYFEKNFSTKAENIINSEFFSIIADKICNIAPNEWINIFNILWNENIVISKLFSDLIYEYQKVNFSEFIYLSFDAVLRIYGTILDVKRLKEIYFNHETNDEYKQTTSVFFQVKGEGKVINDFSKPFLCALSAELIFKLPKHLENSKPFLKNTDLLDFPGARHRLGIDEKDITNNTIADMLLRGKVAYLFNKYSKAEIINILLLCHNNHQSAQSIMPEILKNWVESMVGETPEKRNSFIKISQLPPLFIVSTMFNRDLQFDLNNDKPNNLTFMNNRWERRFIRVLEQEIINVNTSNWFKNWTTDYVNFDNLYVLRDFYYSSEEDCKIYHGFNTDKSEQYEIVPESYPTFRNDLKDSFINYSFVKSHFKNPEETWNGSATINEDGSKLIIKNLSIVSNRIVTALQEKTKQEIRLIQNQIYGELKKHYFESDTTTRLNSFKIRVGNIQLSLDIEFGKDPYFFGKLMNELMLRESVVYKLFLDKIHDIYRPNVINLDKYNAIKFQVQTLNSNDDFDTNLERLMIHYEKVSKQQCINDFEALGIDLDELFYGNNDRVKNLAELLADSLENYWFNEYLPTNNEKLISILSPSALIEILDMLKVLYKKLKISQIIAQHIRDYLEGYINAEKAHEMIADISSEIFNKFINTAGFYYYTSDDLEKLEKANTDNGLGIILRHDELHFKNNTPEQAADLITKMSDLSNLLNQNPLPYNSIKSLPNYRNYKIWYDLLKVAFIYIADVPNYDINSNNKLGEILKKFDEINN